MLVASLLVPLVFGDPVQTAVATGGDSELDLSPVTQPLTGVDEQGGTDVTVTTLSTTLTPGASTQTTRPAARGPLTASDVGVTATTIRIGVVLLDLEAVGPLGLGLKNYETETQKKIFQAYFDGINKRGGLYGRKLDPVYVINDPLEAADAGKARAQCLKMTKDLKVFLVIGYTTDSAVCMATEGRTPVITYRPELDETYRASGNYIISIPSSAERSAREWADALADVHLLDGKTAGILSSEAAYVRKPAEALETRLKADDIKVAYHAHISGDADAAGSQLPLEVQRMRSAGVDSVLLTTDFATSLTFVQTAEGQGWKPRYYTSVLGALTGDGLVRSAPASFDGTIGMGVGAIGASYQNQDGSMVPLRPIDKACIDFYNSTTDGKDFGDHEESPLLTQCALTQILEPALAGAGPNLTRSGVVAAAQRMTDVRLALYINGRFGPGRTDYGDTLRPIRWSYACKCYQNAGPSIPPRS